MAETVFENADTVPSFYSNTVRVIRTINDFRFLFGVGSLDFASKSENLVNVAKTVAVIYMSPGHAKAMHEVLGGLVKQYEELYGTIPVELANKPKTELGESGNGADKKDK